MEASSVGGLIALGVLIGACQEAEVSAIEGDLFDIFRPNGLVGGLGELVLLGQVETELDPKEVVHGGKLFFMEDAGSGRHPLDAAAFDLIFIAACKRRNYGSPIHPETRNNK